MKKLLTLLFIFTLSLTYSQTSVDLSGLTDDLVLGQNCSNSQEQVQYQSTGDVNLNGFEIRLKNATLIVNGNLNGDGEIEGCGQSALCVQGSIQNDVELEDVALLDCSTLSLDEFENQSNYKYDYRNQSIYVKDAKFISVYDIAGRLHLYSRFDTIDVSNLEKGIYIVKTNFTSWKQFISKQ